MHNLIAGAILMTIVIVIPFTYLIISGIEWDEKSQSFTRNLAMRNRVRAYTQS